MLIRTRLFLIGFLPVLLLLALGGAFVASQNRLDILKEKAVLADQLGKKLFELTVLSHDLVEVKSDRPHQQWLVIMQEVQARLPQAKAAFADAAESELMELFVEQIEVSQQAFQELAQRLDQSRRNAPTAVQQAYFANLIQRIQTSLDSALPITGKIHTINHKQALLFAERQKLAMIALLIVLCCAIPLIVLPMMRHITRTTAALVEQEAKFRTVADYTYDWEYWQGANREILYMSPSCERITGYAPAEFVAAPDLLLRIVLPDDRNIMDAHLNDDLLNEKESKVDFRIVRRDGGIRWIAHGCRAVYGPNGQFMGRRVGNRDVTERKEAERQLAESELQLRLIIETEPECVKMMAADGTLLQMNRAGLEMIEADSADQMVGKRFLKIIEEPYRKDFDALIERAFRGESGSLEFKIRSLKGTFRWLNSHTVPMRNTQGEIIAALGVTRDVTARKEAEEELKRSNAELEQFSYAISHDMRQPLRMISSYLQLLEKSLAGQLDGDKQEYFHFAIDGAKRLDQMLLALLEYSRVGRKGEPPEWVESRELLDEELLFLQPAIAEAQAEVKISGDWPRVFVSRNEMMRLLQNLIGNAVKYRVAGRTPEIAVSSETTGNEWRLSVADNGVGILPSQMYRLFQVFQRLQTRAAFEGTGVGLALCRKIAEHHGGRIGVDSQGEGQGSTFWVKLPLQVPNAKENANGTIDSHVAKRTEVVIGTGMP